MWKKVELHDQEESIITQMYKKFNKTDYRNYCGITLLSISYKILSSILSRLSPYVVVVIGENECGFRRNRSKTDQIFFVF
jgi:hypothetical protein